jgi:hypothetical protein
MTGCLDISIWNMLDTLKKCFERVNEKYGTSITVELNDEVFYAGSANATLGEGEKSELQSDNEFQVDGVQEDTDLEKVPEPEASEPEPEVSEPEPKEGED